MEGNGLYTTGELFTAALMGLAVTAAFVIITEYYTSTKYKPVQSIAKASLSGHGTNIIQGLAMSMKATALPLLTIVIGILVTYDAGRTLRHRGRRDVHAFNGGHRRRDRCVRTYHRQRRRNRRDG